MENCAHRKILIILFSMSSALLWMAGAAYGEPVLLDKDVIELADYTECIYVKDLDWKPETLLTEPDFKPFAGFVDPKNTHEAVYWLRFSAQNTAEEATKYYLKLPKGYFWRVNLFAIRSNGEAVLLDNYNRLRAPFGINAIQPAVYFPLSFQANEKKDIYIMIKAYNITKVRPQLVHENTFTRSNFVLATFFGAVYGLFLGLFFYNILLLPILRERGGIVFIGFHLVSLIYLLLVNGFALKVFERVDFEYINFQLLPGLSYLLFSLSLTFTCLFFRINHISKLVSTILWWVIIISIVNSAVTFAGDFISDISTIIYVLSLFAVCVLVIFSIIRIAKFHDTILLFLVCAWIPYLFGLIISLLHTVGFVIPFAPYLSIKGEQIGLVLFIAVAAVGKANHVNKIQTVQEGLRRKAQNAEKRAWDAEMSNRAKTDFLADVSHELRTPLSNIRIPIEQIIEGLKGSQVDCGDRLFPKMLRQIDRLSSKINKLLEYARNNKNFQDITSQPDSIETLVTGYIEDLGISSKRKDIEFIHHIDVSASRPIQIDLESFDSLMTNLIDNALKYTPSNGRIRLTLSEKGNDYELRLANTGEGIPPSQQESVFERGVSIQKRDGNIQQSTGIGLAIARESAEKLRGTIRVESGTGEFTTFIATIPREPENAGGFSAHLSKNEPDMEAVRILLIEDNAELNEHISEYLGREFHVVPVLNGQDALKVLEKEHVDLIISDIMMPGIDGITLMQRIRKDSQYDSLPFIFLTAKADEESEIAGLQAGAFDYITKPFSLSILENKVRNILSYASSMKEQLSEELSNFTQKWMKRKASKKAKKTEQVEHRIDEFKAQYDLTERQVDVLQLLMKGFTSKEIADTLYISPRTVDNHVRTILQKTGVKRRSQLNYDIAEENSGF